MRQIVLILWISMLIVLGAGCGGLTQEDMMRHARRGKSGENGDDAPKTDVSRAASPGANKTNSDEAEDVPKASGSDTSTGTGTSPDDDLEPSAELAATENPTAGKPGGQKPAEDAVPSDSDSADLAAAFQPAPLAERRSRTKTQLEKVGRALYQYAEKTGAYPPPVITSTSGTPLLSWRVRLLPLLGYEDLYQQFHLDEPWHSAHNKSLLRRIPVVYQSPERGDEKTNYLLPVGSGTVFSARRALPLRRIEDGASNTVILLEVDEERAVPWTKPVDHDFDPQDPIAGLGNLRRDGFFVVWGDGLVGRVPPDAPLVKIRHMLSADGGEPFLRDELHQEIRPQPSEAPRNTESSLAGDSASSSSTPKTSDQGDDANTQNNLLTAAIEAMQRGDESLAFRYRIAARLVDADGAEQALPMGWVPGLERPAPAVRWGMGVDYIGPPELISKLSPITGGVQRDRSSSGRGEELLRKFTGELGDRIILELQYRARKGQFGEVIASASDDTRSKRSRSRRSRKSDNALQVAELVSPGIILLGGGDRRDLLRWAKNEGLELLIVFKVKVSRTRSGAVLNRTEIELVDARSNEELYTTPVMSNMRVWKSRQEKRLEDPVTMMMGRLSEFINEQFQLRAVAEEIPSEFVNERVTELANHDHVNPLPALLEIHFYHVRRWIDDDQRAEAYRGILGDEAAALLLSKDKTERLKALEPWLPRPSRQPVANR